MKKSYLITDIEPELWKDFKAACAHYDMSIRQTLIKHIQNIVDDYNLIKWRGRKSKPKRLKEAKKR